MAAHSEEVTKNQVSFMSSFQHRFLYTTIGVCQFTGEWSSVFKQLVQTGFERGFDADLSHVISNGLESGIGQCISSWGLKSCK
jgi:hypothetical protein